MTQKDLIKLAEGSCLAMSVGVMLGKKNLLAFLEQGVDKGLIEKDGYVNNLTSLSGYNCIKSSVEGVKKVLTEYTKARVVGVIGEFDDGRHFALLDKEQFLTNDGSGAQRVIYEPWPGRERVITGFRIFVRE